MATETTPPEPDLPNVHKLLSRRPFWRACSDGAARPASRSPPSRITSQTEAGSKRLQVALVDRGKPTHVVAAIPRAAEPNGETQHLAAQVRELAADRERLTARIAVLEHTLEDMTGSIKRKTSSSPPSAPPKPRRRRRARPPPYRP